MDLRFDVMNHLDKLGKFDGDELEDDYENLLEGVKNIGGKPENEPLVDQVKVLFEKAMGSEQIEIASWAAEQVGLEFKDGFETVTESVNEENLEDWSLVPDFLKPQPKK